MTITVLNKEAIHKAKRNLMNFLCCAVFTYLPSTLLHAQKSEEGFDFFFKPTNKVARYYVTTEQKGDRWYREAFYLPEKSPAMKVWYLDKDCKIAEGEIEWYFANRSPKSKVSYVNGKKDGLSLYYHENGMMRDSAYYSAGHRKGIGLAWDPEGYETDSSNFDGEGNGVEVKWYSNGPVWWAGRRTNDTTKINRWNYYYPNGRLHAIEFYNDGKRTSCFCFDIDGKRLDSLLCVKEEEAHFPMQQAGWRAFLEKKLDPNVGVYNGAPEGIYDVIVQFIIDTDGSIKDIKPLTNFGFGLEAEVVRIIEKSPAWVPAMQYGINVKAYRRQTITFTVSSK
jgi:antitoxin component YwqK of YwqJK toxin-antitoxin module